MEQILLELKNKTNNLNDFSLEIFLVRHVKQDEKYKSWQVSLDDNIISLNSWLKNNISEELEKLAIDGELVAIDYNAELHLHDSIAELDLTLGGYPTLKSTKDLMINSTLENSESLQNNFQIVKLYNGTDQIYIGYYQGIRKSTKRRRMFKIESKKFFDIGDGVVNVGGAFDFIIIEEKIYIINPQKFEYAFKFREHIEEKRDSTLNTIIGMDCFDDTEIKEIFLNKAKSHLYARSLAQVSEDTLENLTTYYNERCEDLKQISNALNSANEETKSEIENEYGILIDLIDLIDLENNFSIIISDETNITPLLHLFQDKIVKSFLTEKVRDILG